MTRRAPARPDLEHLPPHVVAYIVSIEGRLARTRKDARKVTDQLREEQQKNEALLRVLDAADLPVPELLPFTPESSAYIQHCPHCTYAFDRRGFATHEQACARRHGAAPTTTLKHRSKR